MLIRVVPFSRSFDDFGFTYKLPDNLVFKPGKVYFLPFWNEEIIWVWIEEVKEQNSNYEIKEITWEAFNEVLFLDYQLELIKKFSKENYVLIHHFANIFLPKNLKEKIIKWKFILKKTGVNYLYNNSKILTIKQKKAFNEILQNKKVLLHWITGSWKTEIYVNLIKQNLDNWKQTLLMVPEIILTNQVLEYIKNVFWDEVIVLNSSVSEATKTKSWVKIYNNEAKIIVWTRSSLFYPYQNLGSIIIDEEHDESYISRDTVKYDSIKIADFIAEKNNSSLVLWSWTPKIEHMYKAIKWDFKVVSLLEEIWK